MLVTFKSRAGADVLMLGPPARQLLTLLGKDGTQGIVTVEQLPGAISCLEVVIEAERAHTKTLAERDAEEEADKEAGRVGMTAPVSLAQRAWPLLDLLRQSQAEDTPVIWEAR